jgi:hypothetical protein
MPTPFVAGFTGAGQWAWGQTALGANALTSNPTGDLFVCGTLGTLSDGTGNGYSSDTTITCGGYVHPPSVLAVGFVTAMLGDDPLGLADAGTTKTTASLHLYPNPARRVVHLTNRPANATTVRLLDTQGRVVFSRTLTLPALADETLVLPALAPGLYLMECGTSHQRLVIE